MCFGGSKQEPNTNLRPAPYAIDQSHNAVVEETKPDPQAGKQPTTPADGPNAGPQVDPSKTGLTMRM